ncbi:MAG: alanine racemase [Clostridium sp.]|nr:alanine racemase [Clostridium sp.]
MSGREKSYTGIDYFRLIAAFLIVAIHTSPLGSFSPTGDFILTRIIARVGVPFFFMTSGFFLISRYTRDNKKLADFETKTVKLYGAAMLIYLPINLYNGYFQKENFLPNLIKDIVFEGTLYHLWYLPASMAGGAVAWYLVKRLGYRKALAATALLYLVGLFGDSYYGIAEKIPVLREFYGLLFQICDYTRNGIFFAPVFFVLGGRIAEEVGSSGSKRKADCRKNLTPVSSFCGFGISLALMFAEAMVLHNAGVQRHDSMYVFLPPCLYFLFHFLLCFRGKRRRNIRTLSLSIYIIHPMMIVAVRLFAKLAHLEGLLVENSLAHYLAVCVASVVFGALVAALWDKPAGKRKRRQAETDRAYVEINLKNLEHNVRRLQEMMPEGCKMMAVVKTEAYGHGAFEIATHLDRMGIRAYAAATIDEGIRLRKYGVRGEILILGYTAVHRAAELKKYNLTQTLISFEYASLLNKQKTAVKAHIKIDTGMHRLGIGWEEHSKVKKIFSMKNIKVRGIFTHLSCSDGSAAEDAAFTKKQIERFYSLIDWLEKEGIDIPALHIQSSYGLLNYPEISCDYVRIGIAMYGAIDMAEEITGNSTESFLESFAENPMENSMEFPIEKGVLIKPDLRPVLSLKSRVILVRSIKKGDYVGYGRAYQAERDGKMAVLPVGYGDGFPRGLSGKDCRVFLNGKLVPIIGRICMDHVTVDVTDAPDTACGDVATLIGTGEETEEGIKEEVKEEIEKENVGEILSAPFIARQADSISNELLCRLGARLPVVTKEA